MSTFVQLLVSAVANSDSKSSMYEDSISDIISGLDPDADSLRGSVKSDRDAYLFTSGDRGDSQSNIDKKFRSMDFNHSDFSK